MPDSLLPVTGLDVVTLGETMLRLTPPGRCRIEQASELQVHVGGSESNTAVGLARLGLKTAWLSRLPNTALGRMVAGELNRNGVSTEHVVWCERSRMGLYFLEEAGPPRGSQIIYDRRDSACSLMTPDDLPKRAFTESGLRLFHTTGIMLAISPSARETAELAVDLAKVAGAQVSFDINYRSRLGSPEKALADCLTIIPKASVVFLPDRDAETLFELPARQEPEQTLKTLTRLSPDAVWVMTRGRIGSIASHHGKIFEQGIYASDEIGRLGGGDAFSAGFLACYLETDGDVAESLRWAAATSAIKYSMPGDLPLISRNEVEAVLASGAANQVRR